MVAKSEKMDGCGKRRRFGCRAKEAVSEAAEEVRAAVESRVVKVRGEDLLRVLAALMRRGNASRIVVRSGTTVIADIPVTAGIISAVLAPWVTLAATVALLASTWTVEIERPAIARREREPVVP